MSSRNSTHPKMQDKKRESEELHHTDTNFIPIVLFVGFETAYKINIKISHFNFLL
jgi:hypothetical protein